MEQIKFQSTTSRSNQSQGRQSAKEFDFIFYHNGISGNNKSKISNPIKINSPTPSAFKVKSIRGGVQRK